MPMIYCIIREKKERKKMKTMKIPTQTTIGKRINYYAYRAGFTYHPQPDGTVKLFDMRMKYYVFRGSVSRAVQFIVDELSLQSRLNFKSSPPSVGV
jgi:hypothetical protein